MDIELFKKEDLSSIKKCQGLPLSKVVDLNFNVFSQWKSEHLSLEKQVEVLAFCLNKKFSVSALSVALSRARSRKYGNKNLEKNVMIIEKTINSRFVEKNAILTLGSQKEKIYDPKTDTYKDALIDWRGLQPSESMSSWITDYREKLIAINLTGWRWEQIADAINKHLSLKKKISKNTLTSLISLSKNK